MAKAAAKDATVLPVAKGQAELTKEKGAVLRIIPTIATEVQELEITGNEQYLYADSLLGRITEAKRNWAGVWNRIQERAIKPIRDGLEAMYEMNREVDKPLTALETSVKGKMKAWKIEEHRQIMAAAEKQRCEAERLEAEAREKERAAAAAKTPQMRGKLASAAERLTQQATAIAEQEPETPTMGHSSSTRKVPSWRIKDAAAFYTAIGDGTLPMECALVNVPIMNRHFKEDPEGMQAWPGVEVFDDVQIVRR